MMLREIWEKLTRSEQEEFIGLLALEDRLWSEPEMCRRVGEILNVRPKSIAKANLTLKKQYLRLAFWRLPREIQGKFACGSYILGKPDAVALLYHSLGMETLEDEPHQLTHAAAESEPNASVFLRAMEAMEAAGDTIHPILMCAAIAAGGLASWRKGAAEACEHRFSTFRPIVDEPDQDKSEESDGIARTGDGDAAPALVDSEEPCASGESFDPGVFTALDRLLIRTIIDSLHEQVGATPILDVVDIVQELLDLNSSRMISRFHEGFLEALLGREIATPDIASNAERTCWYLVGYFFGQLRMKDPVQVLEQVDRLPHASRELLVGRKARRPSLEVLPYIMRAAFDEGEKWVSFVLEALEQSPKPEFVLFGETLSWVEQYLVPADTHASMIALDRMSNWIAHEGFDDAERIAGAVLCGRLRLMVHRIRGEFSAVEQLAETMEEEASGMPGEIRAMIAGERALAALGIQDLSAIKAPDSGSAESFLARLGRHLPASEIETTWRHWPPTAVLSAIPALVDSRQDAGVAVNLLEGAVADMVAGRTSIWRNSGLLDRARIYLSVLELENSSPENLGRPVARVLDLLRDKIDVPGHLLVRVLESAIVGDAPGIRELANALLHIAPRDVLLTVDIEDMVRQSPDFRVGIRTRIELQNLGISPCDQIEILLQAARGSRDSNSADLDFARWALDEAASLAMRDSTGAVLLSERFEEELAWSGILDEEDADGLMMQLLDRTGRSGIFQGILLRRINAAVADRQIAIARDLIETWEEMGFDRHAIDSRVRQLEAMEQEVKLARRDPVKEDAMIARDLAIIFVGGNETQEQYRDGLLEQFKKKFPGLRITFIFTGWSANWGAKAEHVRRELESASAMVLMPMVRTMFGRTVRKAAGDAGVPWIACTGRGRASLERALLEGVHVAVQQRKRAAGREEVDGSR
jgi:hypothetical protein